MSLPEAPPPDPDEEVAAQLGLLARVGALQAATQDAAAVTRCAAGSCHQDDAVTEGAGGSQGTSTWGPGRWYWRRCSCITGAVVYSFSVQPARTGGAADAGQGACSPQSLLRSGWARW